MRLPIIDVRCNLLIAAMTTLTAVSAQANLYFTDQAEPSTGVFEWDMFAGSRFTSAHAADARDLGTGDATLAGVVETMGLAPPPMVLSSGSGLYSGSALTHFDVKVESADTTDSLTTVVLQLATSSRSALVPESILLDSAAPIELVDRGVRDDLRYWWAEWQVSAATPLTATFQPIRTPQGDHFALYDAQLEYFNGSTVVDAATPALVPEPATLGLAGLALAGLALRRRRAS